LELFLYFFKIGFYTFGGGWSIVAQIQQEYVQKKGWITDEGGGSVQHNIDSDGDINKQVGNMG